MDEVITRIVEIERQCSADIENSQRDSKNKIEAHRQFLEDKKNKERDQIIFEENARLSRAVEETASKIKAEFVVSEKENEILFQDPVLNEQIRENIISILLAG